MKLFFLLVSKPNLCCQVPGSSSADFIQNSAQLFQDLFHCVTTFYLKKKSLLNASGWKDLQGIWKQKKAAKLLRLRKTYSSINHLLYVSESSDGANKWACLLPCLNSGSGRPIRGCERGPAIKMLLFCLKNITFSHPLEHCTLYTAR